MKKVGGFLLFLAVFLGTGIAMHVAMYQRPGLFIWSLQADSDSGRTAITRTTLELAQAEQIAPAAEAAPAKEAPTAPAVQVEEKKEEKPADSKSADQNTISLFDGKNLAKWKKTAFGGEGDVFVNENSELEFGFGAVITGVNWGEKPPATSNFEISLEAMKLDGNDFFVALTFPVKEEFATFVVGGWGGGVVGLSCVDDLSAMENETMTIDGFGKDLWYKIRVRVTDEKIEAWINDEEKVNLTTKDRKISLLPGDIELSIPIGIAAYQTRAKYRNIVWKNLPKAK